VQESIRQGASGNVPMHLRNAPTQLMKDMGYGKDYKYAHDYPDHRVEQQHLPEDQKDQKFYNPGMQGYESQIWNRYKEWQDKQAKRNNPGGPEQPEK